MHDDHCDLLKDHSLSEVKENLEKNEAEWKAFEAEFVLKTAKKEEIYVWRVKN